MTSAFRAQLLLAAKSGGIGGEGWRSGVERLGQVLIHEGAE